MKAICILYFLIMSLTFTVQSHELIYLTDEIDQEKLLDDNGKFLNKCLKHKERKCHCLDRIQHSADISIVSLNTLLEDDVPLFFTVVKNNEKFFRVEPPSPEAKRIIAIQEGIFLSHVSLIGVPDSSESSQGIIVHLILNGGESFFFLIPLNSSNLRLEIPFNPGDMIEFIGSTEGSKEERVDFFFSLSHRSSSFKPA